LTRGTSAAAEGDRLTAVEQQLAVVQRELANNEQKTPTPAPPTSPEPTPAPAPSASGAETMTWSNADALLGADTGGVTLAGDTYAVSRLWLARELAAMQNPGRAPKLAPAPGGVVIRAIKPKSLAAQLGLQNADIITAIDDHPVSSNADIASALHAARGGETHVNSCAKSATSSSTTSWSTERIEE
jgi:membrane-associated protease RseP (regulator of RpoE activity)